MAILNGVSGQKMTKKVISLLLMSLMLASFFAIMGYAAKKGEKNKDIVAADPSEDIANLADFAGLALPGATGLGMAVRAADKAGDAVRVAGKMGKGGKVASEIKGASSGIRTARDVSEGATSADKIIFSEQQVQKKFKHAKNFGVEGNYNNENAIKFKNALIGHINSKDTSQITGTFRGGEGTSGGAGGTHFFNSLTKQWVFVDARNKFVSAWKLKREQVKNLLRRRNVR